MNLSEKDIRIIEDAAEEIKDGYAEHTSSDEPPKIYYDLLSVATKLREWA